MTEIGGLRGHPYSQRNFLKILDLCYRTGVDVLVELFGTFTDSAFNARRLESALIIYDIGVATNI